MSTNTQHPISSTTIQFIKDDITEGLSDLGQIKSIIRALATACYRKFGFDSPSTPTLSIGDASIFSHPMEALYIAGGGDYVPRRENQVTFKCPLEKCIIPNGLNHSAEGWHHLSAALQEYHRGDHRTFEGSILEKYYETWQPQNALEVLIGCDGPSALRELPPIIWQPWSMEDYKQRLQNRDLHYYDNQSVRDYPGGEKFENLLENVRKSGGSLSTYVKSRIGPYLSGHQHYGPVSRLKGELEYARLVHVYRSIREHGYQLDKGGILIRPIKRGDNYRFIIWEGNHRIAAMNALGYETIPASFGKLWIVDTNEVDYWPHVRHGVWDRESALQYVNHLFDFDSKAWARERNLLPNEHDSKVESLR